MNKKVVIILILFLLVIPVVTALTIGNIDLKDPFVFLGRSIWDMLRSEYAVYGITFILFFMLFTALYQALLRRISVFQSGEGVSRQGKVVAVALSFLSNLGIFYFTKGQPVRQTLEDTLGPFSIFAGAALGILTFAIIYFGFRGEDGSRNWRLAMASAGLAMIAAGAWTSNPNLTAWGWVLAFIFSLLYVIREFWGGGGEGEGGGGGGGREPREPEPPITPTMGRIRGYVYDAARRGWFRRGGLPGVQIAINRRIMTATNRRGYYHVDLPPGDHEIIAHLAGYHDGRAVRTVVVGRTIRQDFRLAPAGGPVPPIPRRGWRPVIRRIRAEQNRVILEGEIIED